MSNPNLYALNQITTRYNTAQRSHLRTQQFILWTTSRAAGVFITTQQTISAFHFRSLCFARLRLCLFNPCTKSILFYSIDSPLILSLIHSNSIPFLSLSSMRWMYTNLTWMKSFALHIQQSSEILSLHTSPISFGRGASAMLILTRNYREITPELRVDPFEAHWSSIHNYNEAASRLGYRLCCDSRDALHRLLSMKRL